MIIGLFLNGCSSGNPCKERMDRTIKDIGRPDNISKYDSSGYHSETWWWYSRGLSYTWMWGDDIAGCEKDTYKFKPIKKILTNLEISFTDSTKTLILSEIFDRDCIFCP